MPQRVTKVPRRKSDRENIPDEGKVEDSWNSLGKEWEHWTLSLKRKGIFKGQIPKRGNAESK